MRLQKLFTEIKQISLKSPKDLYSFFEFMTSENPPEVRRSATFALSTALAKTRKNNPALFDILCRICVYELTEGYGRLDSWLERNIIEAFLVHAPEEYVHYLCNQIKLNRLNHFTISRVLSLIDCK